MPFDWNKTDILADGGDTQTRITGLVICLAAVWFAHHEYERLFAAALAQRSSLEFWPMFVWICSFGLAIGALAALMGNRCKSLVEPQPSDGSYKRVLQLVIAGGVLISAIGFDNHIASRLQLLGYVRKKNSTEDDLFGTQRYRRDPSTASLNVAPSGPATAPPPPVFR